MTVFSKTTLMIIADAQSEKTGDSDIYDYMSANNVTFVDTKEEDNRERVFLGNPEKDIFPANSPGFNQTYIDTCCSDKLVSLHGFWGAALLKYDYYIYRVHAFGTKKGLNQTLPQKLLHQV